MKIKNRIYKSELVEWENVNDLQPEQLKEHYNISHLRKSILKYGVSKAYDICEIEGELYWLDGHTRTEMFRTLQSEGIEIPKMLMANFCEVKNRQEAISILLEVHNIKHDPINAEVLTEWVNIEQVEVEVTSLNVVDLTDIEEETEVLEAEEDDFDSTPPETPETVLGDLYEIGEHRLLCGDSTDSDSVAKLMNGEKADMVFTDPPYNVNYEGSNGLKIENDNKSDDDFYQFLYDAFLNYEINLKSGGAIYIAHADLEGLNFRKAFKDVGFKLRSTIIWNKNALVMGRSDYHWKHEPILYGWKEGASHQWNGDRKQTTVWECDKPKKNGEHPTMKPIELVSIAVNNSSKAKDLVLDLFLGSGSTMVASHQLKRKCYGMELDCRYADVIVKRMLKLDKTLKIKKNGVDETKKWLDKI